MKIVKTEGCIVSGINIDGKNLIILEDDEKEVYYNKILEYFKNNYSEDRLKMLIDVLLDYYGEYKHLYHCEQCGDDVYEQSLEI